MVFTRNASRHIGLRRFPSAANGLRQKSSSPIPAPVLAGWYNIFGKSTIGYATWLVAGIVVAEGITGFMGDAVWNSVNRGRTFETVDWTKFKADDDEDKEEEDCEEEEEEEEEDSEEESGEDNDEDDE
ncbi:hypothetical protein ACHAWX_001127 [Stephanocyclus meneghinianus]